MKTILILKQAAYSWKFIDECPVIVQDTRLKRKKRIWTQMDTNKIVNGVHFGIFAEYVEIVWYHSFL